MSAVPKLAAKVKTLDAAHAEKARHVETCAAKAAALETFDDPADARKLLNARAELEEAKAERDVLAVRVADAEKECALAVAEEESRIEEARRSRARKELGAFGESITSDLVALGKKLTAHETLADALPTNERFKFWPPAYAEAATKELLLNADTSRPGRTRELDLKLIVPLAATKERKTA
jgi:hypothetical protein